MPLRSFTGAGGTEWHVWSVIPGRREEERRRGYDRRSPDPVILYKGAERRSTPDRRKRPVPVSPEHECGWLVFEGGGERRRLAPIPPGWEERKDSDLARLCERAQPVAQSDG